MRIIVLSSLLALSLIGCSGEAPDPSGTTHEEPATAATEYDTEIELVTYEWDNQAGDKSVSAELGGPGFTGEGWETKLSFHPAGDVNAVKGGTLTTDMPDWPATVRQVGKDWNTSYNYFVNSAAFMPLVGMDPVTLEYIPAIATHWQISEDKTTYRFRINPEAKWSDGSEITSADVIASWKLRVDPDILDPSANVYWSKYEEPKAVSKYIVEVTTKEENWRNFLGFATASFWPAAEVSLPGGEYLDKYQFAYTSVSGPYEIKPENIVTGQSITLNRRADWWAADNPAYAGFANLDEIRWVVIKKSDLAFEKIKAGELDYFRVNKAQWWAESIPALEEVQRGLLRPQKVYNDEPIGTSGITINMARAPLDDVRIRKALQYLHPTQRMIETLYYNEYRPLQSYWQGGIYMSPENQPIAYDPFAAVELLEDAGWTEKDAEGYRVKDGQQLRFELQYGSSLSERGLTIYQEELKDAGILLELQLLTPASRWKNLREKEFQLSSSAWGAIIFPNPESSWHSQYATQKDNNNVSSYANPKVDALIAKYDEEYDVAKRGKIVGEMDTIIYNDHPYVLGHYLGCQRVLFWNKYSMPKWGASRFVDSYEMILTMYEDPAKVAALEAAKADKSTILELPGDNRFWAAWGEAQAKKASAEPATADNEPASAGH